MAITGILGYSSPPIQLLHCACSIRYVVLVGAEDGRTGRIETLRLNAGFVDARKILAFECFCGVWLDVSVEIYTIQ